MVATDTSSGSNPTDKAPGKLMKQRLKKKEMQLSRHQHISTFIFIFLLVSTTLYTIIISKPKQKLACKHAHYY
jgi:hypothetical protein